MVQLQPVQATQVTAQQMVVISCVTSIRKHHEKLVKHIFENIRKTLSEHRALSKQMEIKREEANLFHLRAKD